MITLAISPDGATVRAIYDDAAVPLFDAIGTHRAVCRASHVEPTPDGRAWTADMQPSGGPILGPYPTRAAALDAERAWLHTNRL